MSERFVASVGASLAEPSDAERVLARRLKLLDQRLTDLRMQKADAAATASTRDPVETKAKLSADWNAARELFLSVRGQIDAARRTAEAIRKAPQPTHGIVTSDERARALEADLGLQQDLRELTVKLAEVKWHLLDVSRNAGGLLASLHEACNEFVTICPPDVDHTTKGVAGKALDELAPELQAFAGSVTAFLESWDREVALLASVTVDPMSNELLNLHARSGALLRDFLYSAGQHLGAIRTQVRRLGERPDARARHHVIHSRLVRAFQTLQAAHHRFEFAAGAIDPANNFRLDAALQGARGLRRRSQERIAAADEQLQQRALERARRQRARDLAETEGTIEQLREMADATVVDLLDLQPQLDRAAGELEHFARAAALRDLTGTLINDVEMELAETSGELEAISREREARASASSVELVSIVADVDPSTRYQRWRMGTLGGLLTLLAVGVAQWRLMRRERRLPPAEA